MILEKETHAIGGIYGYKIKNRLLWKQLDLYVAISSDKKSYHSYNLLCITSNQLKIVRYILEEYYQIEELKNR